MNTSYNQLYLIFRIIGNDLEGLHGSSQTISNLEFTIKNEYMFKHCTKMYVLNRVVDIEKKNKIIKLLNY